MPLSLYDFLAKEIKKMVSSVGRDEKGNIHALIVNEIERYIIELVLEEAKQNHKKAARILGIGRSTLYRKIKSFPKR